MDGKPRPDATIEPRVYRNYFGHSVEDIGPGQTLTTDAEGRFRTPPLPVGRLALTVHAPERQVAGVSRPDPAGRRGGPGTDPPGEGRAGHGRRQGRRGETHRRGQDRWLAGHTATTDAEGKFTLHGFGPNPSFQMNVRKAGYEPLVERVTVTEAGIRFATPRSDAQAAQPAKELVVTLKAWRAGWIEGQAVDADTGEPVRLDRVVVFNFEREPSGEVVLLGSASDSSNRRSPAGSGRPSPTPGEFRLTFSAAGYQDAEVYTPKVTELKTIGGIVARMKKKVEGSTPAIVGRTITGTVTRDGRPVKSGWVALWALTKPMNAVNAPVMRGRTVVESPRVFAAPLRDGAYTLDVPFQSETGTSSWRSRATRSLRSGRSRSP